jgi:hypothetical protein
VEQKCLGDEKYHIDFEEFQMLMFDSEYPEVYYDFIYFLARVKDDLKNCRNTNYYKLLDKQVKNEAFSKNLCDF